MHAQYRVQIPATDLTGFPLHPQLPAGAHKWLAEKQPRALQQAWVEGPHQHAYGPGHHLVVIAEESPEMDSHVKQLAAHVGELANHPTVLASKQGKNGLESWVIPNRKYTEGQPSNAAVVPSLHPSVQTDEPSAY